ncbi:TOBE domain-containing protein, partial [Dubosiella newyorkensis]
MRPENLRVGTKEDKNKLTGRVDVAEMLGSTT